jgi:poly-gamma-glutamate capsule biosynthesis protein CapA/YwtB (metallophosphatase superfamily)
MAIVESKGRKIAFIGFGHNSIVPNVNELDAARRHVEKAKAEADIVVVSFHGGGEGIAAQRVPNGPETYFGESRGNLRAFARAVIDAGADLVLGHGPHVLRGMEIYKDRLIVYSMGNFATYGFGTGAELGLTAVFEVTLGEEGKFEKGRLHPGRQYGRGGPKPDKSGEAIRKVRSLSEADFGGNAPKIADDGSFTK